MKTVQDMMNDGSQAITFKKANAYVTGILKLFQTLQFYTCLTYSK